MNQIVRIVSDRRSAIHDAYFAARAMLDVTASLRHLPAYPELDAYRAERAVALANAAAEMRLALDNLEASNGRA